MHTHVLSEPIRPTITMPPEADLKGGRSGRHGIGGVNRIGEQYYSEEPTLAGRFRNKWIKKKHLINFKFFIMFRPTFRSEWTPWAIAKGLYYIFKNNKFVKVRGTGACPPIPSLWFGIEEFVKFKNRPFIGRFGVKFCKIDFICIGIRG